MKKVLTILLVASFMVTSALSLSSCKKEAANDNTTIVGDVHVLPVSSDNNGRPIQNYCHVCGRELFPAPAGTPLPPPLVNTDYSCYHEYQLYETCPYVYCNLYPRHHYHFYYVGYTTGNFEHQDVHIGGGNDPNYPFP